MLKIKIYTNMFYLRKTAIVSVSTNLHQNSHRINTEGAINAMDFNPDGSRIVVAGRNGIVNFYLSNCMSLCNFHIKNSAGKSLPESNKEYF